MGRLSNKEYHVTDCVIGIANNIEKNKDKFLISVKPSSSGGYDRSKYTIDKSNTIKRIFLNKVVEE